MYSTSIYSSITRGTTGGAIGRLLPWYEQQLDSFPEAIRRISLLFSLLDY